jgi:hypothetical protein
MALDRDQSTTKFTESKEPPVFGSKTDPGSNLDLEGIGEKQKAKFGRSDKSVGGRIAPVLPHLRGYDFGSDDSGEDILGKQIELEAGNAIQYRTCSWQKVGTQLSRKLVSLYFQKSPW